MMPKRIRKPSLKVRENQELEDNKLQKLLEKDKKRYLAG